MRCAKLPDHPSAHVSVVYDGLIERCGLEVKDKRFATCQEDSVPAICSTHPLVQHKLATLRDIRTRPPEFRRAVRALAALLAQEATVDLPLLATEVTTPLAKAKASVIEDVVGIVPILRAGLGMAEGIVELFPDAEVWHIGLFRDEVTLRPMEYYNKFPSRLRVTLALLVDPMLATGGSAVHACEIIKAAGVPRLKLITLLAAPEGIDRMGREMPDVPIHVGAIDERLNEIGFIYPGLGDAGDRQFATGRETGSEAEITDPRGQRFRS
jgi:uracil phosphoribosyltransferase